jgi:hypothetical protein
MQAWNKMPTKIYVAGDFSLHVVGQGDVPCRHGNIFDFFHVPNINENLLLIN